MLRPTQGAAVPLLSCSPPALMPMKVTGSFRSDVVAYVRFADQQSENITIGLSNVSALISPPVLGQYVVCGEYPDHVTSGATVSIRCNAANLQPARYVIVQLNITFLLGFCDLNVCARGTQLVSAA